MQSIAVQFERPKFRGLSGYVIMTGRKGQPQEFETASFAIKVSHFYGWIIFAVVLVLGSGYAMYQDISGDVGDLSGDFQIVLTENARMAGRLDAVLPFLERQMFERASTNPEMLDLVPVTEANIDNLKNGFNIVNTLVAQDLSSQLGEKFLRPSQMTPYAIYECLGAGDSPIGDLKCAPLSAQDAERLPIGWFEGLK